MESTQEQKAITAAVRNALKKALKEATGAERVHGIDTHYCLVARQVRPSAEGNEPKALLYGGNPYVLVFLNKATAVNRDENGVRVGAPISKENIERAWEHVSSKVLLNRSIVNIHGIDHYLLDPRLTENDTVVFGFSGIRTQHDSK